MARGAPGICPLYTIAFVPCRVQKINGDPATSGWNRRQSCVNVVNSWKKKSLDATNNHTFPRERLPDCYCAYAAKNRLWSSHSQNFSCTPNAYFRCYKRNLVFTRRKDKPRKILFPRSPTGKTTSNFQKNFWIFRRTYLRYTYIDVVLH